MSAKQSGQVWELDLSHKEAWVLMALADHADHEGNNVFPGQGLIAWKTGYSERNVRRILESLESKKIIIPVSGGRGRGVNQEYKLALENAKRKPPYSRKKRTKCPVKGSRKRGQDVRLKEPEKEDILSSNDDQKSGQDVRFIEEEKADKTSSFSNQPDDKKRTKQDAKSGQNESQKADNLNISHDKERARINRHESSCEPLERETRTRKSFSGKSASKPISESDKLKVALSPIALALCAAVGWKVDVLSHNQWFNLVEAEKQISAYESATPERIQLAPQFYRAQGKYSFKPQYISQDWGQIEAWLEEQERREIEGNGSDQRATRRSAQYETRGARAARETLEFISSAFEASGSDYGPDPEGEAT